MINWRSIDQGLLYPEFNIDVSTLLAQSEYSWTVTYGFRTRAEQQELYDICLAGGPKAAPPGMSAHEYGLAIDVALIDNDKRVDWNTMHEGWIWLFDAVFKHPRLHSGRSFDDADHIERLGWKSYKDWNV